ncbi:MAG: PhzF family phenazine biosynthesis protein [Neisseriaceae bacterium]|nr:PhzF family phenazine biosynthesis protein [Neisseriaceae bacterium]MBP6861819.1 PhzF family phenazine biosynthesis protein [Neisseriaceae bacterium]
MRALPFYLVNVFAETVTAGNPLAVVCLDAPLSASSMQALAKQMNLSETVFIERDPNQPQAEPKLHIYTPSVCLPFAGYPILGAAYVLQQQGHAQDSMVLHAEAGPVSVRLTPECVWLKTPQPPTSRVADLTPAEAAAMLGLTEADVAEQPLWVSTGSEQLLIQLASKEAVLRAKPNPVLFETGAYLRPGRTVAYVWYEAEALATVRMFTGQNGAVVEDPGTGSACANLGGLQVLRGQTGFAWRLAQGECVQRLNILHLEVKGMTTPQDEVEIWVGGAVLPVGEGLLHWPG